MLPFLLTTCQDLKFSLPCLLICCWSLPLRFLFDILSFAFSVLLQFGFSLVILFFTKILLSWLLSPSFHSILYVLTSFIKTFKYILFMVLNIFIVNYFWSPILQLNCFSQCLTAIGLLEGILSWSFIVVLILLITIMCYNLGIWSLKCFLVLM